MSKTPETDALFESDALKRCSAARLCRKLEMERDEADRRAGAAERKLECYQEKVIKRDEWLRKAKKSVGYTEEVSFDKVWAEARDALLKRRRQEQDDI